MRDHSLVRTLKSLRGNPRGCVYTEPLWGIPYNLYSPYASLFMVALGLTDKQVGLIISVNWACQIFMSLISGAITDKLGRRLTTLIFDILSWSVPAVISAVAQNFWFFLVAAVLNSVWRVTHNSWNCLLVEDADPAQLVDIYTWIYIANLMVGFVAPLAGGLIGAFSLVGTVRGLYGFAAVMFTVKAVICYVYTEETAQGRVRLRETRDQSLFQVLGGYRAVLTDLLHSPKVLATGGLMLVINIYNLISSTFWAIMVAGKLGIPAQQIALFPFIRSAVITSFFFLVMPRVNRRHFKVPMMVGFAGFIASQVVLINAPRLGYGWLALSVFLEAGSFAAVNPLVDRLTVLSVNAQERARMLSLLSVGIILISAPFGWIGGALSEMDKALPFVLNIGLFIIGAGLAYVIGSRRDLAAQPAPAA